MTKEEEIMQFLHENVFDSIMESSVASNTLKQGVRQTIMRLNKRDARGMVHFYWSAIIGTEKSIRFAAQMRAEGFTRFEDEEVLEEFRIRFNDNWLRS